MEGVSEELLADKSFVRLLYIRQQIANIEKKLRASSESGAMALTSIDYGNLQRLLEMAAYATFDDAGVYYTLSKIGTAVRHLIKEEIYGHAIAGKAQKLHTRWKEGNFDPGPADDDEDDEFSSAEETESDDTAGEGSGGSGGLGSDLMRGILLTRGPQGGRTYTLDPAYQGKREAAVFGANGLEVGAWWPYQICALRDGAHGSRMGGIHGRTDGAYSVVISGAYDDTDHDQGDVVYYSGSRGADINGGGGGEAVLTNASKSLMMSKTRGKPVRLLRAARGNSKYAPAVGIRYDGLYDVIAYDQQEMRGGKRYWRFTLRRRGGQAPIDRSRPAAAERREYVKMRSNS